MLHSIAQYEGIVREFREITNLTWSTSMRCCKDTRDGVPECIYQLIDGAEITFTLQEIALLIGSGKFDPKGFVEIGEREDGAPVFGLQRSVWSEEALQLAFNDGELANTLECASHPTRPIVGRSGQVLGVVVIDACNGPIGGVRYHEYRERLLKLWQGAVDLCGMKNYYCTWKIKEGWTVL